jgi:divalent metal cation (Fe/Co/Zn/Cd) transporter
VKEGSRRVVIAAFLAKLGIAIAKFVGFIFTGSASILTEAVHSVADTGNQGLLLLGGVRARADRRVKGAFRSPMMEAVVASRREVAP